MKNKKYQISQQASSRIDDIYNYTFEKWGVAQATEYLDGLFARFQAIANKTVPSQMIQTEYEVSGFYVQYEKHFIYWKHMENGQIGVAEILHQRMNQGDHLAKSEILKKGFSDPN